MFGIGWTKAEATILGSSAPRAVDEPATGEFAGQSAKTYEAAHDPELQQLLDLGQSGLGLRTDS